MTTKPLQRLLYVEDEPDIRAIARIALETVGGFEIKMCSSGQEAIDSAPAFIPDLILLDVMMPGLDGPSTLKALRALPEIKEIPVIFMTAKVQAHETAHYRELGAVGVISKPFDPMMLAENIRSIWIDMGKG
ncbi:MAG TPA: response regulator [Burkholderiales bacterium]|nr:response regulator [Burkholderiales bacterium]